MDDDAQKRLYFQLGLRIKEAREKAGLTQKELAKRIGVTYNKIYNIENGISRAQVADLIDVSTTLNVPFWSLIRGLVPEPDLRVFIEDQLRDLVQETTGPVEEIIASFKWIERRHRVKHRMFYRPMYYVGPRRVPIEFDEEWENPMEGGARRLLYIQRKEDRIRGYFFKSEIVPSHSQEVGDTPVVTTTEDWENEEKFQKFLQKTGYCWQLYPIRNHCDDYCSEEHRTEIKSHITARTKTGIGTSN